MSQIFKNIEKTCARLHRFGSDLFEYLHCPDNIPLLYFNNILNVGDQLSPYIIEKLTGKKTRLVRTTIFPRVLGIGSILSSATYNSYIWGCGSIDGLIPQAKIDPKKIFALRGEHTFNLLRSKYSIDSNIALGDPALLLPQMYSPSPIGSVLIGLIPHYVDYERIKHIVHSCDYNIKVIDVRQKPEPFINELVQCKYVISSSLHGLILSDAYKIPNLWIDCSGSIVGGTWKFHDYYSTTDNPNAFPYKIETSSDLLDAIKKRGHIFKVSNYKYDLMKIATSFPPTYLK